MTFPFEALFGLTWLLVDRRRDETFCAYVIDRPHHGNPADRAWRAAPIRPVVLAATGEPLIFARYSDLEHAMFRVFGASGSPRKEAPVPREQREVGEPIALREPVGELGWEQHPTNHGVFI